MKAPTAILDAQEFLNDADRHLGNLAGAALTEPTYMACLAAEEWISDKQANWPARTA